LSIALAVVIVFTVSGASPVHAIDIDEYFNYTYDMVLSHEEVATEEPFTATISGQATCIKDLPLCPSLAEFSSRAIGQHTISGAEVVLNPSFMLTVSPFPCYAGESGADVVVLPMTFPPDSEPGTYTIIGEIIQAKVRALFWVDVTDELPSTQILGTVSLSAPVPELVSIAVTPEAPSIAVGSTQQFAATGTYDDDSTADIGSLVTWNSSDPTKATIDAAGEVTAVGAGTTTITATLGTISGNTTLTVSSGEDSGNGGEDPGDGSESTLSIIASTEDGGLSLDIEQGTTGSLANGEPVMDITIDAVETPPTEAGGEVEVIGTAYDLGPDGAIFDRPLVAKLVYDESLVPDGLTEQQLTVAFWDSEAGEWVRLESEVDIVNNTVTALVDHFTVFAVIAPIRLAAFTLSGLTSTPEEIAPGESSSVSVLVTNAGDLEGDYPVVIGVNGTDEETRVVTLSGGASQTVTFSVSRSDPGTYTVETGDLVTTFVVKSVTTSSTDPATPYEEAPISGESPDIQTNEETTSPEDDTTPPVAPVTVWWRSAGFIGGLAGAAVVVLVVLFIIIWRRRFIY